MDEVTEAIQRLDAAGLRFHPPASDEDIQAMAEELSCILLPEIVTLYQQVDGMLRRANEDYAALTEGGGSVGDLYRLMSTAEVREMHPSLVPPYGFDAFGRRCFWADDQSNYAALYVEGPLAGRVCLLNHEELDPAPVYRSVASFLTAVANAGKRGFFADGTDYPTPPSADYPALGPADATEAEKSDDQDAIRSLVPLSETAVEDDERILYAFSIMALTPYESTADLLRFSEDEDFYIQERACDLLGLRRWESAIPTLEEVALHGVSNGKIAAIRALGRIGTGTALRALVRVHEMLPASGASGWWYLFEAAFAACGCEVNGDRRNPRYREPGANEWKPLRR
jgi:hypothetical protein